MFAYQLVQQQNNLDVIREVLKSENSPLDISPLHGSLSSIINNSEILNYLKTYDITNLIAPNTLNDTFPCHFFNGNLAWMSETDGHYRYFTRNYKGFVFSLDVLDLLRLYYETESIGEVISRLSQKAGIIYLDKRWRSGQMRKYGDNVEASLNLEMPLEYRRLVMPLLDTYRALNEEAKRHLGPMNLSFGHEAMFFVSHRYLAEKLGKSSSQIARICLMLEYLGLIEVMSDENIPTKYLELSKEYAGKKRRINYYIIPEFINKKHEISGKCQQAMNNSLKLSNISREYIAKTGI